MIRQRQPNYQNQQDEGKLSPVRMLIFLVAVGVLGVIIYRYYFGESREGYTNIPEEVQIKYVPSEFRTDVDLENALPILQNPYRYSREFDQLIHDFNLSLLNHVANRMNLTDSLKIQVRSQYEVHHPYISKLMFNDFVALADTSSALYGTWYQTEGVNAVNILNEVASKYTCFFINQILATLLKTEQGKIYVKGEKVDTPCGVALTEGLQPMIARLRERAAIDDFSQSKGILQERVEQAIAELGTMEIRDRKGIGASRQTKVFGMDVSSTEMEMSAISILKVGFKLDKYFNVELSQKSGVVTVTMPEPEILSHEVFPRIDKLDVGWLREIDQADFNRNMDLLRREFRQEALESDVMDKSKIKAAELMETLLMPVIKGLNPRYQLKVRFKNVNTYATEKDSVRQPTIRD